MGVLPAGASSVLARQLGFHNDAVTAARELAAAIRAGSTRSLGLGLADSRLFTFAAGLGLDAEATEIVDRTRRERPGNERPGDLRVLATALGVLRSEGFALHERMTLTTPSGDSNRCSYIAVANQHPYTFLGPLPVRAAPRADFEHGMDVVFTRELRSRDLWRLPVYGLIWPRHAGHGSRRVGYLHDLERFTVDCDEPTAFQLDGEYVGHVDRVEFSPAGRGRGIGAPRVTAGGVYHSPPMDLVIAISQGLGLAAAAGLLAARPAGDRRNRRHPGLAGRAARLCGRCRHRRGGMGARGRRAHRRFGVAGRPGRAAARPADRGRRLAFELAAGDKLPTPASWWARRSQPACAWRCAACGRARSRPVVTCAGRRSSRTGPDGRGRARRRAVRRICADRCRRLAAAAPAPPRRCEVPRPARAAMTAPVGEGGGKKLILAVVDGLGPALLDRAIAAGRAPTMAQLAAAGERRDDCVSTFPSLTPVCSGRADHRQAPGGVAHSRDELVSPRERRLVEYGSSFAATLAEGTRRMVEDVLVNMNLVHLSHEPTVFEALDDAGLVRPASTPTSAAAARATRSPVRSPARLARSVGSWTRCTCRAATSSATCSSRIAPARRTTSAAVSPPRRRRRPLAGDAGRVGLPVLLHVRD